MNNSVRFHSYVQRLWALGITGLVTTTVSCGTDSFQGQSSEPSTQGTVEAMLGLSAQSSTTDLGTTNEPEVNSLISAFDTKLLALGGNAGDFFGFSVAASGDTVLVGALHNSGVGAAYVFVQSGGVWTQQAVLFANDAALDDSFGITVALDGDTALIGAYTDDDLGPSSGSAYVFVRSGGMWTQQAKLLASDGHGADFFGRGLALSGDTAVVGAASHDNDPSINSNTGAAYVFVRNGTGWSEQAKLEASDPGSMDQFGYAVAIDGDTVVVGAYWDDDNGIDSGSGYVFARNGVVWTQQAKLLPVDGTLGDNCGRSVAISGDTALVGAPYYDATGSKSGAAYVFERSGGVWTLQTTLLPFGGGSTTLGWSVAISGDVTLVGAPKSLSVFVYERAGGLWTGQVKLVANGSLSTDDFG